MVFCFYRCCGVILCRRSAAPFLTVRTQGSQTRPGPKLWALLRSSVKDFSASTPGQDEVDQHMCTRRSAANNAAAAPLRRVFPPCLHGNGSTNINIQIFDQHGLVDEMATSNEVVTDLQNFLNGLASQPGLDPATVALLSQFTFRVTYANRMASQSEIDHFGMNDFPIYFLTATPPVQSSDAEIVSLLEKHRIPETIFVWVRVGTGQTNRQTNGYRLVEADWTAKPSVLGFGFPGPYFLQRNQNICRKLGIIKMRGGMIENLQFGGRRQKLVSVLKHELGHMFGNDHVPNTIMDEHYSVNANFPSYTNDQLVIVGRALEILRQN